MDTGLFSWSSAHAVLPGHREDSTTALPTIWSHPKRVSAFDRASADHMGTLLMFSSLFSMPASCRCISVTVVEEALRAARRVNDYSTAVRIFEGLSKLCNPRRVEDSRFPREPLDRQGGQARPLEELLAMLRPDACKEPAQVVARSSEARAGASARGKEEPEG